MKAKNITEITVFSQNELIKLIDETIKFSKNKHRKHKLLKNKCIGLVFDSNSLRTRLSFETAIHLLGGSSYFIDVHRLTHELDGTQRESFEDIIDTLDRMVDAYVLRDYSRQMYNVFLRKNNPPFINGFCYLGHPSQALADLSVITRKFGTYQNLFYAAVGPSTGSGVIESFIYGALILGQKICMVTPTGKFKAKNKDFNKQVIRLQKYYGGKFTVDKDLKKTILQADVLYVDEWWENTKNYLKRKIGAYQINMEALKLAKEKLVVLHCLPAHPGREITAEVMHSKYSIIFDEAEFRIYSAMSLLQYLS